MATPRLRPRFSRSPRLKKPAKPTSWGTREGTGDAASPLAEPPVRAHLQQHPSILPTPGACLRALPSARPASSAREPQPRTPSPQPGALPRHYPGGSLTDPEHLRGGGGDEVTEEIEERPAGVPGPEPGLGAEWATLHHRGFLMHAEPQPRPHVGEMQRARAGSPQPHPPPWDAVTASTPAALAADTARGEGERRGKAAPGQPMRGWFGGLPRASAA